MHLTTVKHNGKINLLQTLRINTPSARVPKHKRQTMSQIIERRKRAERDARLVRMW